MFIENRHTNKTENCETPAGENERSTSFKMFIYVI